MKSRMLALATAALGAMAPAGAVLAQNVPAQLAASPAAPRAGTHPDFSGMWTRGATATTPFRAPPSGAGPVLSVVATGTKTNDNGAVYRQGDYRAPVLQPWAAEVVRTRAQSAHEGKPVRSAKETCWPMGVPYILERHRGNTTHVSGELFKIMTGVDMVHVPYRDLPYSDLIAGRVQVYFSPIPAAIEHIRAGTLRALAVTATSRVDALPDIPTMADFIPGFEAIGWAGVGAPKKTPAEIIEKLNKEINAGLADPKINARFADLGSTPILLSPAAFRKFVTDEVEKWAKVIRAANIRVE
jgi:hypothetical protein